MTRPRLGFLGLGWIGRHRLEAVSRAGSADIVGLADTDQEACARAQAAAPGARVVADLDALLALGLDGVVIATPSALHAAQSIEALTRGVAVFAQKPLARTADETAAVVAAARRHDRRLAVDFSYRHTAAVEAVAREMHEGTVGEIFTSEFAFHNAYGPDKPWFYERPLSGGGCLIDLGSHLVDLALWLNPDRVKDVSSSLYAGGRRLEGPPSITEDFARVSIEFDRGNTAEIACSWRLAAGRDAVIEARWYGTRGGLRVGNVGGSFYDFAAERFDGTKTVPLVSPPDDWGGRAIVAWTVGLRDGGRYDPAVEDIVAVADVLDRAYGVTSRSGALA